jgi:hypothetical protein
MYSFYIARLDDMDDKLIEAGFEALRNNRNAESLLHNFVYRHKRGLQQDKRVMDFLHDAFCQILCNVPADKALHLKDSKPGPKSNSNWERDLRIYEAVIKLHKITKEVRTLDAAFDKLENDGVWVYGWFVEKPQIISVSRRTIEKAYYKYRKMIPYNK